MHNKNRLLGIDYGSKRIGVALSDESGSMATPHSVVATSAMAMNQILRICSTNNVKKIIIGESKNYSGTHNPIMTDIQRFVEGLRRQTDAEIVYHPEFLTSAQAERLQGKNDMLDASAATLILQSYIDSNRK